MNVHDDEEQENLEEELDIEDEIDFGSNVVVGSLTLQKQSGRELLKDDDTDIDIDDELKKTQHDIEVNVSDDM